MNPLGTGGKVAVGGGVGSAVGVSLWVLFVHWTELRAGGWPDNGVPMPPEVFQQTSVAAGILVAAVFALLGIGVGKTVPIPKSLFERIPKDQTPQPQPPAKPPVPMPPQPPPKPPAPPPAAVEPPEPPTEPIPGRVVAQPAVQNRGAAIDILARTLWAEARGEPLEGQKAVCEVICNRVNKPRRFPETVEEVCLQPQQFSCWNDSGPTVTMSHPPRDDAGYLRCVEVATPYVDGRGESVLPDGTDHYYAPAGMVPPGRVPSWAKGRESCAVIGGHIFFNNVP